MVHRSSGVRLTINHTMNKLTGKTIVGSVRALIILATCLSSNAQAQRLQDWQSLQQLRAGDLTISNDHYISTWVTENFTTSPGGSQIY